MTQSNDARLAQIKARLAAATPGPWTAVEHNAPSVITEAVGGNWVERECDPVVTYWEVPEVDWMDAPHDAEFIAHAPDDIAWLLAEHERLTAALHDRNANAVAALFDWMLEPQECGHPIECIPDHKPEEAATVRCGWCADKEKLQARIDILNDELDAADKEIQTR